MSVEAHAAILHEHLSSPREKTALSWTGKEQIQGKQSQVDCPILIQGEHKWSYEACRLQCQILLDAWHQSFW